ncbi:MAG: hypothetical protein ACI92G_001782 [Candidatus Pelagisphaera sp.]
MLPRALPYNFDYLLALMRGKLSSTMAKSRDAKKNTKKAPQKTAKEKKAAKRAKKE